MLTIPQLQRFAQTLATNLTTHAPYHDPHLHRDSAGHHPFEVHPAFGNCYDWHSSVNSSWAVARLARLLPAFDPSAQRARAALCGNVTTESIATECRYFAENPTYERPYGWAWLLALYSEVDDELREMLRPLAAILVESATRYFTGLIAPITHGVHSNTAFAGVLMSEAAAQLASTDPLTTQFADLTQTIAKRAREWYEPITNWPAQLERSGHDFLSPGLTIAELMVTVLVDEESAAFVDRFLPRLDHANPIVQPANTRGSIDAQQVHWHGLNLSRSGQLRRIAAATGRDELLGFADELYAASLAEVTGDNFASTHWLASFALRAIA